MVTWYAVTLFVSAFLLFWVQPMVGKMVLPLYGGTPAVWNACMVFFQVTLLTGYAYAHLSIKWFGSRRQAGIHMILMLLPIAVLPIVITHGSIPPSDANPVFWLLGRLVVAVGLPFFVVSGTAPLLQRWFSTTDHPSSKDPYFLYAASNFGSFLALLGYPFIFEPLLDTVEQGWAWSAGYILLILMMLLCVFILRRRSFNDDDKNIKLNRIESYQQNRKSSGRQKLFWVFASFIPSSLMLSVTSYITTNISAIPLFWVLPLALYLLTFILVFSRKQVLPHSLVTRIVPFIIIPLVPFFFFSINKLEILLVPIHLLLFFVAAMFCHGELAMRRPVAKYLTEFYLWISIGGVMGGVFNVIIAPIIFNRVVEYPLAIFLVCTILPGIRTQRDKPFERWLDIGLPLLFAGFICLIFWGTQQIKIENNLALNALLFAPAALLCFSFKGNKIRFTLAFGVLLVSTAYYADMNKGNQIYVLRNFYGVKRVVTNPKNAIRYLYHGNTIHGAQFLDPARKDEPLTYYHRSGPVGDVFNAFENSGIVPVIAAVGLGVGSISSYAKPGYQFVYYEIDPGVKKIASDNRYFTFLADTKGSYDVVLGDGRLTIARATDHKYGMIILDAFNSDAIPIHLLTKEAVELYLSKLKTDDLLVFHISNRFLNLEPLMGSLAKTLRLVCLIKNDSDVRDEDQFKGKFQSTYVVMGRNGSIIKKLSTDSSWNKVAVKFKTPTWTDKYSNVLSLLKW